MGYYEQRGKSSWRIREAVKIGGRTRYVEETLRFPSSMPHDQQLQAVQAALADLEADVRIGAVELPQGDITLAAFAQRYLADYIIPATSANNHKTISNMLDKRILPALGATPLRRLTTLQLQQFINGLTTAVKKSTSIPPDQRVGRTKDPARLARQLADYNAQLLQRAEDPATLSARTVHQYYAYLSSMLERAVKWGYLTANPMTNVTPPKYRKRKMQYLDDDQAVGLLRKLAQEENVSFRAGVLLALLCGLRLGEVGALTHDDVDYSQGCINISKAVGYTPATGTTTGYTKSDTSDRIIDLPPGMLTVLQEARAYQDYAKQILGDRWRGVGRIVCNWDGSPMHHDTPSKQWRKFADRNGYKGLRFHELRHSHASILLSNNIDVVAVASRLGHGNADITLKEYAHALRKRDKASADVMQQLLDRATTVPIK